MHLLSQRMGRRLGNAAHSLLPSIAKADKSQHLMIFYYEIVLATYSVQINIGLWRGRGVSQKSNEKFITLYD